MREFKPGDIISRYQRELLSKEELKGCKYLYKILSVDAIGIIKENLIVFQELWGDYKIHVEESDKFYAEISEVVKRDLLKNIDRKYVYELYLNEMEKTVYNKRTWSEFRNNGLLWYVNTLLNIFGWSITISINEDGDVCTAYPSRTISRGFARESNQRGYRLLTKFMLDNMDEISKDLELTDNTLNHKFARDAEVQSSDKIII